MPVQPPSGVTSANGSAVATASHRSPTLRFRPPRHLDGRVPLGLGLAVLSMAIMAFALRVLLPEQQTVLEATRDMAAATLVQAADVAGVQVRLPEKAVRAIFSGDAADQVVGKRVATKIAAGQLLAPSQFEVQHATVAPGRVQVTVPVDPYTASAGAIGPGDMVVVYSSARQAATDRPPGASIVIQGARVVAVGRAEQGLSVTSGGGASSSLSTTGKPVWITLDLSVDEGARIAAASRETFLDMALLSASPEESSQP
jgi:Flp pilus assembly protein CpaB